MQIALLTQGCRANKADSGWLMELAKKKNFTLVEDVVHADAAIINTCTVTHGADRDARMLVRQVRRLNPDALVCLVGCYSQNQPQDALALEGVDYVGGTASKERVLDFLERTPSKPMAPYMDRETFSGQGFLNTETLPITEHTRLFLKIQDGCNHRCTYCIIHKARGRSVSMTSADVVSLIHKAQSRGIQEVVLTGIDLGSFGELESDAGRGMGLVNLLKFIEKECSIPRLRLSSLSPLEISDELIETMASSKFMCPSFHISLQHGSRKILKLMARPYGPELFVDRLNKIYSLMPRATVSLDVIVGFPGEDDDDFKQLFDLLQSTQWMKGHFFPYSARTGTPSSRFPNQVVAQVKSQRMRALLDLGDLKFKERVMCDVGRDVDVLVERARLNAEGTQWELRGHTHEFVPALVSLPVVDGQGAHFENIMMNVRGNGLTLDQEPELVCAAYQKPFRPAANPIASFESDLLPCR